MSEGGRRNKARMRSALRVLVTFNYEGLFAHEDQCPAQAERDWCEPNALPDALIPMVVRRCDCSARVVLLGLRAAGAIPARRRKA